MEWQVVDNSSVVLKRGQNIVENDERRERLLLVGTVPICDASIIYLFDCSSSGRRRRLYLCQLVQCGSHCSPGCARAPALSTAKLSPAMTTALPRSISSVTTALTIACFYTPSTSLN